MQVMKRIFWMTTQDTGRANLSDGGGLHIGYLIPEFPGQTHTLFWRQVTRLRNAGVAVHLVSTTRPRQPCAHAFRDEPCTYVWPVNRLAMAGLPSLRRVLRQVIFALKLPEGGWRERLKVLGMIPSSWMLADWGRRHDIDHLHVHSFANSAYLAALFQIATGRPYSLVLHGDRAVYGLNHAAKLAHADFACGINQAMKQQIDEVAPGVCLDEMMPCGVPLETFTHRVRQPGPVLRLISVGRLNHCKGIGFALAAIARIRDRIQIEYTLVGSGPHEAEIHAQAVEAGVEDLVHFVGSRSEDEIVKLLHRHDVAVLTSHGLGETTAIAIREATATGMPVIMSDIGDAHDMIEPFENGLIVPQGDVQANADAILWFAENRERIPTMGASARKKAERDFSDAIAIRTLVREVARRRASQWERPACDLERDGIGRRIIQAAWRGADLRVRSAKLLYHLQSPGWG
jgi:glycosyltransferase involved in cell wall biosynthesis